MYRREWFLMQKNKNRFRKIFGFGIEKFASPMFGFDVVGFDKAIKTPDGVSCADHIKENYGEDALVMIESFLGKEKAKDKENV